MGVRVTDLDEDIVKAFWHKVHKWPGEACWQWRGGLHTRGYGKLVIAGKERLANHVAWVLENGELPHNHVLTPKCNNRSCVRPDHWDCISKHLASRRASGAYSDFKAFEELGDSKFHVKLGRDLQNAGSSQSRIERMVRELVEQMKERQQLLDETLGSIRSAAAVPAADLRSLREEVVRLVEAVELLAPPPAPARPASGAGDTPDSSQVTERPAVPETLAGALRRVLRETLPKAEVSDRELLQAFDLALAQSDHHGEAALHTFTAWTFELKERVHRGVDEASSERLLAIAQRDDVA